VPGWDDNVKSAAAVASVSSVERCFRVCSVASHAQVTLIPSQARHNPSLHWFGIISVPLLRLGLYQDALIMLCTAAEHNQWVGMCREVSGLSFLKILSFTAVLFAVL